MDVSLFGSYFGLMYCDKAPLPVTPLYVVQGGKGKTWRPVLFSDPDFAVSDLGRLVQAAERSEG